MQDVSTHTRKFSTMQGWRMHIFQLLCPKHASKWVHPAIKARSTFQLTQRFQFVFYAQSIAVHKLRHPVPVAALDPMQLAWCQLQWFPSHLNVTVSFHKLAQMAWSVALQEVVWPTHPDLAYLFRSESGLKEHGLGCMKNSWKRCSSDAAGDKWIPPNVLHQNWRCLTWRTTIENVTGQLCKGSHSTFDIVCLGLSPKQIVFLVYACQIEPQINPGSFAFFDHGGRLQKLEIPTTGDFEHRCVLAGCVASKLPQNRSWGAYVDMDGSQNPHTRTYLQGLCHER